MPPGHTTIDDDDPPPASAAPPRFVWPPRRAAAPGAANAPTEISLPGPIVIRGDALTPRTWRTALRDLWLATEDVWLEMTVPPLAERLARWNWTPDELDAFCPRCAMTIEPHDAHNPDEPGCAKCEGRRPAWDRVVRLGPYRAPLATVIREIKFTRWRRLGLDLGRLLGDRLAPALPEPTSPIVLVPVPMSWPRRLTRGMDHTLALCRGMRRGLAAAGVQNVTIRRLLWRRHRPSQLAVLPSERRGNVSRSIRPRRPGLFQPLPEGCLIVVVDDVMTTGATMQASCRAVREGLRATGPKGRRVWGMVAARTETADGDRDDGDLA